MTTMQQTNLRVTATEMVLHLQELSGSRDVFDTEDLIDKASDLYIYLTTGRNVYETKKTKGGE